MLTKRMLKAVYAGWLACALAAQGASRISDLTDVIRAVGLEGSGNPAATRAWRTLSESTPADELPQVLGEMDGTSDLALNWLRLAVESIADRELAAGHALPVAQLRGFVLELGHHPRARRLAYELIARVDPSGAEQLMAGMVNDPSPELRRDAVQKRIDDAQAALSRGDQGGAARLFEQSLAVARDVDQIDGVAEQLRKLGQPVDLPRAFGFLMRWKVIGPFDNAGGKAFDAVYPPETRIDLAAEYTGKNGPVRWIGLESTDEHGTLSMNKPFGALKGVAAYALAEFHSDQARSVELRLGSENAWKLWLNGKYLFGQNEYHRNKIMDQFIIPAPLQKGANFILVKVCQNEQTEDWAGDWDFQLRVCDASGTPVRSAEMATAPQEGQP
jgi:hypothetical protein